MVGAAGFEPTTTSPPDWCKPRARGAGAARSTVHKRDIRPIRLAGSSQKTAVKLQVSLTQNLTHRPPYHRPMARKPNLARIYEARRAAIESRLTRTKVLSQEEAARWLAAWEAHAAVEGQDRDERDFWDRGHDWIVRSCHPGR